MFFITMMILLIMILISVACFTLLERKILSYIQIRKGPNKVGLMGILQPFSDAIKLFTKEQVFPTVSNSMIYYISPVVSLMQSLILWIMFPFLINCLEFNFSILFFLRCASTSVYMILGSGWSSNSNYSLLGALRSIAQTISYEVSLALTIVSFILMIESFSFLEFYYYQKSIWFIFVSIPLSLIWVSSCMAETNRSPFDFAEGESELVSGFNVEYSSGMFAIIFMSEYSNIIFMSMTFSIIFLGSNFMEYFFFFFNYVNLFLYVWIRGTLPRYRYDKLMYLSWKSFLPLTLNYFILFISIKLWMIYHFLL